MKTTEPKLLEYKYTLHYAVSVFPICVLVGVCSLELQNNCLQRIINLTGFKTIIILHSEAVNS
jgi:hypothetical protein